MIRFVRATYKEWLKKKDFIVPDGAIIFVTKLPWYKSWFGLRPTRMKLGDGKTTFNKLKFI